MVASAGTNRREGRQMTRQDKTRQARRRAKSSIGEQRVTVALWSRALLLSAGAEN